MKRLLISVISLFIIISFSNCGGEESKIDCKCTEVTPDKGNIFYKKGADEPFTGTCEDLYENGDKFKQITFKDGKMINKEIWYENGQKQFKHVLTDDAKRIISLEGWYENGDVAYDLKGNQEKDLPPFKYSIDNFFDDEVQFNMITVYLKHGDGGAYFENGNTRIELLKEGDKTIEYMYYGKKKVYNIAVIQYKEDGNIHHVRTYDKDEPTFLSKTFKSLDDMVQYYNNQN